MMRSANLRATSWQAHSLIVWALSLLTLLAAGFAGAADAEALGTLKCHGKAATIITTNKGQPFGPGRDVVDGTRGRDVIVTLGGRDEVYGDGGNDLICTGGGNDYVYGGDGDDRIWGGGGKDYIVGSDGDDRIWGGGGDDYSPGIQKKNPGRNGRLVGGSGDDRLYGGNGRDLLRGNEGDDRMYGEAGADDLDGGADTDLCSGGGGFDRGSECESLQGINDSSWAPLGRIVPG